MTKAYIILQIQLFYISFEFKLSKMYLENKELNSLERILDALPQNEDELYNLIENNKSDSFRTKLNNFCRVVQNVENDKTNSYKLRKHIQDTNNEFKIVDMFDKNEEDFSNNYKKAKVLKHRI